MGLRKDSSLPGNKLNVLCLVSYNFLPPKMGGQKAIALFYASFSKYVNITCVTTKSNDPGAVDYEVLNVLSNSPLRYINFFYFFLLRKIIKERNITHLQIEHPYYGWLALLIKWFCRIKLIVHSHNIEGERFKSTGKWWWKILLGYERKIYRNADYIFFITDEDRNYAINNLAVDAGKCLTTPYGIDWQNIPTTSEKAYAKGIVSEQCNIESNEVVLLMNGSFTYKPNADAVRLLLESINPVLAAQPGFKYRILICGKDIPADISNTKYANTTIAGFVPDIAIFFKAADIFLNPVTIGGGIKTKVVEALGYDLSVITFPDGAIGIPAGIVNNKLVVVANDDIQGFVKAIISTANHEHHIPAAYFDYFYGPGITKKAAEFIAKK